MATIKYHTGIPPIPEKWRKVLSGLLDSIGMSSIVISSTRRSLESNSAAMYKNLMKYGVKDSLALYNTNMDKVVKVFESYVRSGYGQTDTVKAMTAKASTLPLPVHCRAQDDTFTVFDVPPEYIPENMKKAFENVIGKSASKFISPVRGSRYFMSNAEPVYHIEFGGVKTETLIKTGSAVAGLVIAAFLLLRK